MYALSCKFVAVRRTDRLVPVTVHINPGKIIRYEDQDIRSFHAPFIPVDPDRPGTDNQDNRNQPEDFHRQYR